MDQGESSVTQTAPGTIDCLPPPYTLVEESRRATYLQRSQRRPNRSESMEYIVSLDEDEDLGRKICCDREVCKFCLAGCLKFKRVLLMLAASVLCCMVISIALGVVQTPKNNFITLSLMFAGLGLLLVTVVLIGWRCTPPDHEPCHLLFGLGAYSMTSHVTSLHRGNGRLYWIGGRLFPEFRYRRPPPSYTTSMHEYEAALANLRNQGLIPQTPPPQYKVRASTRRAAVQIVYPLNPENPHSLPPAYREALGSNTTTASSTDFPSNHHSSDIGIENPVFECHLEEIVVFPSAADSALPQDNRNSMVPREDNSNKDNQNNSVIYTNAQSTVLEHESSLREVTHL